MPTVSVGRDRLFAGLGKTYTQEEFEELCFDFGIELDDVTTEKAIIRKEKHLDEEATEDEEVIYKIEVPAIRYDLLCLKGLEQALRIFNGLDELPNYKLSNILSGSMLKVHVKPEASKIRPFIVCAVLRGVTFDEARYNSFIDLQDKLHQNICQRRALVAIGTHDLDTIQVPFTHEVCNLLNKMQLHAEKSTTKEECSILVSTPPTRTDILHACDLMEDVAIAYGFNKIPKRKPAS